MSTEEVSGNDGDGDLTECPWDGCGYTTESEHGIKIHHKRSHGVSLSSTVLECAKCGTEFSVHDSRADTATFCSMECTKKENNTIEIHCEQCGCVFEIHKSRRQEARFCSQSCYGDWKRENEVREDHPQYKEKVEKTCSGCGDVFFVHQYRSDTAKFCSNSCSSNQEDYSCAWCGDEFRARPRNVPLRFCSRKCDHKWRRENYPTGQSHHSWRGGYTTYQAVKKNIRNESWQRTRRRIRSRDAQECQMCGEPASDLRRALDVHHIVPLLSGGTNADELLTSLCNGCHHKAESYTQQFTDPLLTDWTDDELPEGRERWTPDDAPTEIQPTLDSFAPADD